MKISVVMPSFNQGKFIKKGIESFLSQQYFDKELIIIDNQSTDNTLDIVGRYLNKIQFISEKDKGQTNAINKGLMKASGEILAYLNSDDRYEENAFNIIANFFKKHPEVKIVYGKSKFIDEEGKFIGFYKTKSPTLQNLFKECVISQPTVFFRRELLDEIGFFDEALNFAMDYDYWIRVAKKYKFGFINKILASTRLHKETKTASQKEKVFAEILEVIKKNYGKVSDEAVFNYAYVVEQSPLNKIRIALLTYKKYKQLPGIKGLRIFGILFKSLLFK